MVFDPYVDIRSDARSGDPDRTSPTLRAAHQFLWDKELPNGERFTLDSTTPWTYLHHQSRCGEFWLSSDSIIASYSYWTRAAKLIEEVGAERVAEFDTVASTIGATILFPSNKIDNRPTINMARGTSRSVADRFDLTLECIRRFYAGQFDTPLGATLQRYADFFELFGDFKGYAQFFLLQDLLTAEPARINFFLPFESFDDPAVPQNVDQYESFMSASTAFVDRRNARMQAWAASRPAD